MKTQVKNCIGMAVASFALATVLVGCEDTNYATPTPATTGSTTTARALFVNASPNAPALDFFVENVSLAKALAPGQNAPSYATIPVGNVQLRAKASSGQIGGTLKAADILFRAGATNQNNFGSASGLNYTVFVTDTIQRPAPTAPAGATNPGGSQFLVVTDNLAAPAAGNAHVRFLHLAPDVTPVSLRLVPTAPASVTATTSIQNRAYRVTSTGSGAAAVSFANFTPVSAATYTAQVFDGATIPTSATVSPVLSVTGVTLVAGKIYTIYARGLRGNNTLGAGIVTHN